MSLYQHAESEQLCYIDVLCYLLQNLLYLSLCQ